jgi:isopentenyl diphosphate isomerase/L-lactate dehydrogenase-like FMN-dependent dehydrogenase
VKDPQKDLEMTIKMVGKHLVLPTNETPTMATVSDPEKLKDQAFFANAKKGDKVLIYANSQKAILYDPESDRIVEVAPINTNTAYQAQNAPVVQTTTTKK